MITSPEPRKIALRRCQFARAGMAALCRHRAPVIVRGRLDNEGTHPLVEPREHRCGHVQVVELVGNCPDEHPDMRRNEMTRLNLERTHAGTSVLRVLHFCSRGTRVGTPSL